MKDMKQDESEQNNNGGEMIPRDWLKNAHC
jgi:hypothetical protein